MDRDRAIDVLVRFARLVSDAAALGEILPILADAIRENATFRSSTGWETLLTRS